MISKNRPNESLDLVTAILLFAFAGAVVSILVAGCLVIGWQVGQLIRVAAGLL